MKRIFTLLVLTLSFGLGTFAQKSYINYDKDSKWFFGINGGATWHSRTEIKTLVNGGYGFTFGRSFGMKPENLFSWDLRLRYLHGWWAGQSTTPYTLDSTSTANLPSTYPKTTILQSYQDTAGNFIPNFRTQLFSGSLELALNTNRLRQNTGWNFQIFGGIGIKAFNTRTDITDGSGQIYDYSGVGSKKKDILAIQDGNYETNITGTDASFHTDWMGSFGAGISYQVAPWASIGISHKMTWTRSNDLFDGMPNNMSGAPTTGNDIYHYSSAGIKFHLFGGHHGHINDPIGEDTTHIENFDLVDDPIVKPTVQRPIVDIYDPGVSPYTVEYDHFTLRANVHHVAGKQNITFKQNGNINNNFSYNSTSDNFESQVILQPGQNIFEITGSNEAGQDYESTIIVYKQELPLIEPPIVTITNPPYSPYTTTNNTFNFASTVLNVDSKSQIKVYFNGVYFPNFTYNVSSKALNATLNLLEGTNTVTVTATNDAGSDSKTAKIIYEKPQTIQPPVVNFIYPSVDPFSTNQSAINVTASVLNVENKNNISVKVNGYTTTNFTFNTATKQVNFSVNLLEGANVLQVTGSNQAGVDQDVTTIIYNKPEAPKPPIVTFVDPAINPTTVYNNSYNVTAKVLNVDGPSNITLKINGVQSYNFAYSTSSKLMTFTTNLLVGSNVIEIKGTNNVGLDMETTTIIYKPVIPQAPPVVNITYPAADNEIFATPSLTLSATVLNVNSAANIAVSVNGNSTSAFSYNTATKVLYLPLTLLEGTNTVTITGTNNAGTDSATRLIIHKKPVVPAPPTVSFVNPPSSPHLVTTNSFTVTANTTNIDTKSQITFLHNGNLIPNGLYTFTSNHQIIYNATLIPGSNIFDITVTNNDGSDQAMSIVTYKVETQPCIIPTVGYISPVPYSTVQNPNVNIDAQINNYSSGTVIEMLLNGVSQGFMTFNQGTSIASKAAVLNEGSNAITVIVTNNCGSNQATFTLNYVAPEAPCIDPTVTPNGPTSITTQNATVSLQAGVSEITSSSGINVTINGQSQPFTFDQGTNSIAINNVPLALGNNAIVITATNDCGTGTLTYYVVREQCNLPIISNSSPANAYTSSTASLPFTVNVANATQGQIEMVVNNISQAFTFNSQTHVLSAALNLNEGSNSVVIKATNSCGTATQSYTFNYEVPCVSINTSLLNPATETATVTDPNYNILLHATGSLTASGISATLNGNAVTATFDEIAGDISLNGLTLNDGVNTVVINLSNDCSNKTVTYTITYNGCQPPVISIPGMSNGASFNTSSVDFQAVVQNSNGANNITLQLNGNMQSFDFNDQTNLLTSTLSLIEGTNTIDITVNGCQTATQTLTITYTVPCEPIAFTYMQPASNTATVTVADYSVTLNLLGIDNSQQLTVKVNNVSHPFTYDAGTHILTISDITLINGQNSIQVNATNACSNETINYSVQYNGCQPPVITLGTNASTATAELYNFAASVTNITNSSEIQVLHNGAPIPFVFDSNTGNISGDATLTVGANTFVITANGCASDTKQFQVTYTIPCKPIVYAYSTPGQAQTSVADETYAITLVAQFADPNTISVTLNGTVIPHTYANDLITIAGISLIDGTNTVVVNMSNDCSNETLTYTITHDGCDTPVINITGNPDAATTASYNLAAQVANITNQSDITVNLNGNPATFNFNAGTGALTAQLTLNQGANVITITANGCASATATLNVNYTIPCIPVSYTLASPSQLTTLVNTATTSVTLEVQNVMNSNAITVTLNGNPVNFTFANNVISLNNINLNDGANTVVVAFSNACSNETVTYVIESDQCESPIITVSNSNMTTNDALYTFICNVQNVTGANNVQVNINGQNVSSTLANGVVTSQMSLQEGANQVMVTAFGCDTTSVTYNVNYEVPCDLVTFNLIAPGTTTETVTSASYTISLGTQYVGGASSVSATLNGTTVPTQYNNQSGQVTLSNLTLVNGTNTIIVNLANDCDSKTVSYTVTYNEPAGPCGPRFNPGNSEWEFCLVTPNGTYNRDDLANNSSFTYSGPATAVYFKPIAGGGDAIVDGQSYPVQNGQYYLFQGNLTVDVSSSHPGSMGHWEICITADAIPQFGNGNNKPTSPCQSTTGNNGGNNGNNGNNGGSTDPGYDVQGNGTVTTNTNFCATIKCLGESVVYSNSQDAYVTMEYSIDGGANWFEFNGGNYVNGNEQLTVQANTGSNIVLKATCVNQGGNWSNTEITNTGSQYVYVLQNGDQAPNFAPSQGQASVETFLAGYVDGQGHVTIGPNDVIYLFELRYVGNVGVDYQDCVMLITLNEGSNCPPPSNPTGSGNDRGQVYLPPTFTHMVPNALSSTVSSVRFDLKTKIENVNDQADIKLFLNNTPVTKFGYDFGSSQLTANLNLISGQNTIKIEAINGNKTNQVTYKVNCQPVNETINNAPLKPVITDINPANTNGISSEVMYNFKAQVTNVVSNSNFKLSLNNTAVTNFTYNPSNKQVSAALRLTNGVNTIKLTAINGSQQTEKTYTVEYKPKEIVQVEQLNPTITNVAPTTTSSETESASYTFKAKVGNVPSKSNIKLYLNGQSVTTFTYTANTQLVTAVIRLNPGANTIKLEAEIGGKKAERTYTINYAQKEIIERPTALKPTIVVSEPALPTSTVSSATLMFKGKVQNVTSKASIQLIVNGISFTTFSYSSTSGDVSAVLKLRQGVNTIQIKAINGSLKDEQTFTVTYTPQTIENNGGGRPTGGGATTGGNTNGGSRPTGGGTSTGGTVNTSGGGKTTGGGTSTGTDTTIKTTNGTGTTTNPGGGRTTGGGTATNGGNTKTTGGTTTNPGSGKTTGGGTSTNGGNTRTTGSGTTTNPGGGKTSGGGTTTNGGNSRTTGGGL